MLFIPLAQQDLEFRHPGLENELWSSYAVSTKGDGDNLTLAFVGGSLWTITDTDATFSDAVIGLYGVLAGFWGFLVTAKNSTVQITVSVVPYPVDSITQADIVTSVLNHYSIGGFASQIITASEEIVKDMTRMNLFPEAFDWTERNRYQLEPLFCYKTIELISADLIINADDTWALMNDRYNIKYANELNELKVSYQKNNENIDDDNFVINKVVVRR